MIPDSTKTKAVVLLAIFRFVLLASIAQNVLQAQMALVLRAVLSRSIHSLHLLATHLTKITAPGLVSQDTFRAIRRVSGAAHHYALLVSTGPRAARQPTERVSHAQ